MPFKLLLVDDDPQVLRVVQSVLESLGCTTVPMADSREAHARVGKEKFDGAVVDAQMPYLDGFALVQQIRHSASNSSIPIIMLTGYGDVETMRKGFRAGVTFFLTKPIVISKMAGLLHAIRGAMLRGKRKYARLPLGVLVECRYKSHEFKSESVNISEGGMLLEGSGGVEVGHEISLRVSIPRASGPLTTTAIVVRREGQDRMAVRFTELDPNMRKIIQDYIAGTLEI